MITCTLSFQDDPSLERHFKGHRDTVTSVDFNCNMKQIGMTSSNKTVSVRLETCSVNVILLSVITQHPFDHHFDFSHWILGLLFDDLEHEASDEGV